MQEGHFEREKKISRKQAEGFILDLANYSEWRHTHDAGTVVPHFSSIRELETFCLNEIDDEHVEAFGMAKIVERARVWETHTHFENLLPNFSWSLVDTGNVTLSFTDGKTGKTISTETNLPLTTSDYQSKMYHSWQTLSNALHRVDYASLMSAISTGVSALDSYLNYRAEIWNATRLPCEHVQDTRGLRFKVKIDDWIPRMCGGVPFDKSAIWHSFGLLKKRRDNIAEHPKLSMYDTNDFQLLADAFTKGIAQFLFGLHKHFGEEKTPSFLIRMSHAPKVVWVPERE